MRPSVHNILGPVRGSDRWFIANLLSGNADLLEPGEAEAVRAGRYPPESAARGYLVDDEDESREFRQKYLDFLDARERDEVQVFLSTGYSCNFACGYCFQAGYPDPPANRRDEIVDAFYSYVDRAFAGRRKYVTLFGGEPLLPGERRRDLIGRIVDSAAARGIDVAVVTNGYELAGYIDVLKKAKVREVQVTLDGVGGVHDRRRPLKNGGATFERIVEGVDAALSAGFPVNLRVVVDRENLAGLPDLARFASSRGWTESPIFKTQIGRNYELHQCHAGNEALFSRAELYSALFDLLREHPEVAGFHRPAFSLSRFLFDNGALPDPLFDSCPGCKTEWAFDLSGRIFPCTAMVGKQGEEVGTFWPRESLDESVVSSWQERDVLSIPGCRSCSVSLVCGGGCAAVAKNKTGRLDAPDCRPAKEIVGMGMAHYFAP